MNKITRGALVLSGAAGSVLAVAVPSFADTLPTTPPDVSSTVDQMGGALSNGVVSGFVSLLPFAIPVLIIFTVWGIAKRLTGVKKSAR